MLNVSRQKKLIILDSLPDDWDDFWGSGGGGGEGGEGGGVVKDGFVKYFSDICIHFSF